MAVNYNSVYTSTPLTVPSDVSKRTQLSSLNLNWREQDSPEREGTKHVHRLHPYLAKFISRWGRAAQAKRKEGA